MKTLTPVQLAHNEMAARAKRVAAQKKPGQTSLRMRAMTQKRHG